MPKELSECNAMANRKRKNKYENNISGLIIAFILERF
jgi:hypothetical protein